jgi:plasmid stabilization system protein ParE
LIKLSYTAAAQKDLVEFFRSQIGKVGAARAEYALESVVDRCEDLARFPQMGRRRPDLDAFGMLVHAISESGRTIVYTRRGDTLHIVRLL